MKIKDELLTCLTELECSVLDVYESIDVDDVEQTFSEVRRQLSCIAAGINQMMEDDRVSDVDFEGVLGRIQFKIAEIEKFMNVRQREW